MDLNIIFSKRASKNLENLLEYLEKKWSKRVKENFIKKLDKAFVVLKENPESSPKTNNVHGLHRCVVTKQITVFYKFDKEHIYVVALFDTRQNPEKLKKKQSPVAAL